MAPPRWLADEMVGRLARYLRLVGCDTVYVRGVSDEEILSRAKTEGRILLTRDRELARRTPRAVLIASPHLADQWRAVRAAHPEVPSRVRPERCTECNGRLALYVPPPDRAGTGPAGVPWERVDHGLALYRCAECGHLYWEGSHTAAVDARIAAWEGTEPRAP